MPAARIGRPLAGIQDLTWAGRASGNRPVKGDRRDSPQLADSVEELADASFGDVFGGPRTITRWAIVDPGPF